MSKLLRIAGPVLVVALLSSCGIFGPGDDDDDYATLVYVATTGSDTNTGLTAADPLLSIATAVGLTAADGAEVRIAAGTYTMGAGLPSAEGDAITISGKTNFKLSGGWDDTYSAQSGTSALEGPTDAEQEAAEAAGEGTIMCRPIVVTGCTGVTISGFTIRRGGGYGKGGGISFSADNGTIADCAIEDCTAYWALLNKGRGGGIYVEGDGNTVEATVTGCAANLGGAIYVAGTGNTIRGTLGGSGDGEGNRAGQGGGLYVESASTETTVECAIIGNSAADGGGAYVAGTTGTISGEVSANLATDYGIVGDIGSSVNGGGIYLAGSSYTVTGEVHDNSATFGSVSLLSLAAGAVGGGLYVTGASDTIEGDVWGNLATLTNVSLITLGSHTYGGGIYASGTELTVTGDVRDNEIAILSAACSSAGAGIYLSYADGATVSGSAVTGNVASTSASILFSTAGHGIYMVGAVDVTLSGCEIGNNGYSGFYGTPEQICLSGDIGTDPVSGDPVDYPVSGLVIDGCTIYGPTDDPGYGIYEATSTAEGEVPESVIDVTGHTITDNTFSSLDYLYHDFADTDIAADAAGIALLNTANDASHGATTASGNVLQ